MNSIKKFFIKDREYFRNCKHLIVEHNNYMLSYGSIIYAAVLIFYTILTAVTKQSKVLANMYYIFDAIHLVLCLAIFFRPQKTKKNFMVTQIYCFFLELSILSFFALEGTLTSKTEHSLYIPIAILLIQLLFIHYAVYANLMNFIYIGVFCILAYSYKDKTAYINDFYVATATFISSVIAYILIATIRHNEGSALKRCETLSKMDQITGLYNRFIMDERCQSLVDKPNKEFAFILIDIEDLKYIKKRYGYKISDEIMRKTAYGLKKSFENLGIIGRFDEDEFIILVENVNNFNEIENVINESVKQISSLWLSNKNISIDFNIGITFRKEDDDVYTIYTRAESAITKSKANPDIKYKVLTELED